jgi:hypothetical protein
MWRGCQWSMASWLKSSVHEGRISADPRHQPISVGWLHPMDSHCRRFVLRKIESKFKLVGQISQPHVQKVWQPRLKAIPSSILLGYCFMTGTGLQRKGLPYNTVCIFCDQSPKTAVRIALLWPFSKEVWSSFWITNPTLVTISVVFLLDHSWRCTHPESAVFPLKEKTNQHVCTGSVAEHIGIQPLVEKAVTCMAWSVEHGLKFFCSACVNY